MKCRNCIRVRSNAYAVSPIAVLPEFRVHSVPPFTNVGIDLAGPLYYKPRDTTMEKCYIVLYSCCKARDLGFAIGQSGKVIWDYIYP